MIKPLILPTPYKLLFLKEWCLVFHSLSASSGRGLGSLPHPLGFSCPPHTADAQTLICGWNFSYKSPSSIVTYYKGNTSPLAPSSILGTGESPLVPHHPIDSQPPTALHANFSLPPSHPCRHGLESSFIFSPLSGCSSLLLRAGLCRLKIHVEVPICSISECDHPCKQDLQRGD